MLHRQLKRPQARHLQGQHRHETARLADPIAAAADRCGSVLLSGQDGLGGRNRMGFVGGLISIGVGGVGGWFIWMEGGAGARPAATRLCKRWSAVAWRGRRGPRRRYTSRGGGSRGGTAPAVSAFPPRSSTGTGDLDVRLGATPREKRGRRQKGMRLRVEGQGAADATP
jgi:hypothetical protein